MRSPDKETPPERGRNRASWLFVLLLLLFGGAFYLSARSGLNIEENYARLQAWMTELAPTLETAPAQQAALTPTFDIVRAEPTGELVIAGRAQPGWKVRVESGGKVIGETAADANGEWVLQPEKSLEAGDHSLSLRAVEPNGQQNVQSSQRVALSVSPKEKQAPMVALTEQGKPTKILQTPPQDAAADAPARNSPNASQTAAVAGQNRDRDGRSAQTSATLKQSPAQSTITFNALDYERTGDTGKIFMNGVTAPNSRVMLYLNNAFVGMATSGADGAWTFAGASDLPAGSHQFRADQVDPATGKVLARAEVTFERSKADTIVAAQAGQTMTNAPGGRATQQTTPASEVAPNAPFEAARADMARKETAPSSKLATKDMTASVQPPERESQNSGLRTRNGKRLARRKCNAVTVQRGDTLWHIARRCYGDGDRFSAIFRSNQGQIRDPDLIYPSQRFVVPRS